MNLRPPFANAFFLMPLIFSGSLAPAVDAYSPLPDMAFIGDSQLGDPGDLRIGAGLTCMQNQNIIGFANAKSTSYVGSYQDYKEPCGLSPTFGSYHNELTNSVQGNPKFSAQYCAKAHAEFQTVLNNSNIKTVVIGLGDNQSDTGFSEMIKEIKAKNKNCVWVQPAQKIGNNTNTDIAAKTMVKIANDNGCTIINPSADGQTFQTIDYDKVHYTPDAGRSLGNKICAQLDPDFGPHPEQAGPTTHQNRARLLRQATK